VKVLAVHPNPPLYTRISVRPAPARSRAGGGCGPPGRARGPADWCAGRQPQGFVTLLDA